MAYFGLSKPWIAPWTADNTYDSSKAFKCGKLTGTSVTPNFTDGSLYADNGLQEYVKEFVDADVNADTDRLPIVAAETMFGHKVSGAEGTETISYSADDTPPYVGYAFIVEKIEDNVKSYQACLVCKVKFSENAETYTTKGNQITFGTPQIAGKAVAQESDKVWRIKSPTFTTEADAEDWIKTKLGIADDAGNGD